MPGKIWSAEDIIQLSSANWPSCVLQTAVKLDLFTALDRPSAAAAPTGLTVEELALKLACEERALDMLITALAALGFLKRAGRLVTAAESSRRYLSRHSEDYLGFIIKHQAYILPGWVDLETAVRTGRKVRREPSSNTANEQEREAFLMGMFNVARQQADTVARALDLSGRKRLLDLGGGPGTYAVFFCRRYPDLRAVVFDLPGSEQFARQVARRYGLTERIDFIGGDFLRDELPRGFDAVWLSQVLHGEPPAEAARLVERGAKTLNPGGLLAIQEFILNDDRQGPAHSALFALNMLVGTEGGQAYSQSEIELMMGRAGARHIRRLSAALPPGCGIMVGDC